MAEENKQFSSKALLLKIVKQRAWWIDSPSQEKLFNSSARSIFTVS